MTAFFTPTDVGNRAAQHVGAEMMDTTLGFTDGKVGRQIGFVYDKLRRAELRRNTWVFATRRAILRPIDTGTMMLSPALWSAGSTYFVGSIVSDSSGNLWQGRIVSNLANQPGVVWTAWEPYFGPLTVTPYDSTIGYSTGELVYVAVGDGTYRVYLSLQNGNTDVPGTATAWSATVTYYQNQVVTRAAIAYMSLVDLNLNQTPPGAAWTTSFTGGTGSVKWLQIGGAEAPGGVALAQLNIVYPIGSGPASQSITRNAFRLPAGYLRQAPLNPKAGIGFLGAPTNSFYSDWLYEGNYIVASDAGPITLRFVADVTDVAAFDDMFAEGLALSIGLDVCEPLAQSASKKTVIAQEYKLKIGEARTVNSIESGYEDPPEDDFLSVRL